MRFTSDGMPVLAIIGPSGAGKSTAIQHLHSDGLVYVNPTWTTRPPRPGEVEQGIEHHFVTEDEFETKDQAGYFLETVQMFGLPYRYGLPPINSNSKKVPVVMVRASLMPLFNKYYPNNIVYQIEDDVSRIKERLDERQQQGEALGTRLDDYNKEVNAGRKLAKRVFVNEELESLIEQIRAAICEDYALK